MIYSENNAYGWGASKIAMPRAALELHPQRRPETGGFVPPGRPNGSACRWRPLPVSGIFLADCPWRQFLALALLASILIVYLYLLDLMLPRYQAPRPPKPVEIIIAVPKTGVVPDEQRPEIAPVPVTVAKETVTESIDETERKPLIEKPKEITPPVLKELPPEPKITTVQVKPQMHPKKAREPRRVAAIEPDIVKPQKPAKINIPPPMIRKRSYVKKGSDKSLQPPQMSKTTHLSAATSSKFSEDIDVAGPHTVSQSYPLLAETQTSTA